VLVLALVHGGLPIATATAGVIIYRIISLGVVSLVGWLLWLFVERTGREHVAPREELVPSA
jgi:uncharacterized membrane protein YbhN (UPF0104 family)